MFFDYEFMTAEQALKAGVDRLNINASIMCMFGARGELSTIYRYEELLDHSRLYMAEMRSSNPSRAWQAACDEFERFRKQQDMPKEIAIVECITHDLEDRVPTIRRNGFDLGVLFTASRRRNNLLAGGNLIFAILPRGEPGKLSGNGWPVGWAQCTMTYRISDRSDHGVFWGLIGNAVREDTEKFILPRLRHRGLPVDAGGTTAHGRRKRVLTELVRAFGIQSFFITDEVKYCYLNHALNVLVTHLGKKLGLREQRMQTSDETLVTMGENEAVTYTPKPFMRVIK